MVGPERHSGVWLRRARVCALFVGLTAVMTWPSVLRLATHSVEHQDIFFNMWRIEWVRHALLTSPRDLFNGNQFYPERGVLAYSDAMMVESLIALPLLSVGLPAMLVHNLLLLGVIAASGIGMFVLARYLWGNTHAAIIAGLIFAFAPYRFSHFMHMELQWAVWMPWAFWAMQRTLDTGALRYGLLTGLFMTLQLMSSIYYGLFLAMILAAVAGIQAIAMRRRALRGVVALGAGAVVLAVTAWVYSGPYRQASARVGLRTIKEMREYSAVPSSYLRVPEANRMYGTRRAGDTEVSLYPGIVPVVLGLIGLVAMRPKRTTLAYAAGLALAIDFSLGINGLLYPHLQYHVTLFKGLRAPSRASILFLLCLAVLAARAAAAIFSAHPRLEADALRHGDRGADPRRILVGADAPDPVSAQRPALRLPGEAPGRQRTRAARSTSRHAPLPGCALSLQLDSSLEDAGQRLQRVLPADRTSGGSSTSAPSRRLKRSNSYTTTTSATSSSTKSGICDPAEGVRTVEDTCPARGQTARKDGRRVVSGDADRRGNVEPVAGGRQVGGPAVHPTFC